VVKAVLTAAAPSPFEKTIYVKVSGAAQPMEIKIKGEVLNADAYAKYEAEKEKKSENNSSLIFLFIPPFQAGFFYPYFCRMLSISHRGIHHAAITHP